MSIDPDKARRHYEEFLACIGLDTSEEGLADTPERVTQWMLAATANYRRKPQLTCSAVYDRARELKLTTFPAGSADQLVFEGGITFNTICMHHMMPFFGTAYVAYLPKDKIIGLSKLPRVVDFFSKRPQTQEYLTSEIVEYLVDILDPLFVGVLIRAQHTCVSCRGVLKPDAYTITSKFHCLTGEMDTTKKEFLSLVALG